MESQSPLFLELSDEETSNLKVTRDFGLAGQDDNDFALDPEYFLDSDDINTPDLTMSANDSKDELSVSDSYQLPLRLDVPVAKDVETNTAKMIDHDEADVMVDEFAEFEKWLNSNAVETV